MNIYIRIVPKLQSSVFLEQMLLQYLRNFEICSKILEDWSKKILYWKKILHDLINFPDQINHPKILLQSQKSLEHTRKFAPK